MKRKRKILVVAGEASADLHLSNVLRELNQVYDGFEFVGMGGEKLKDAGVEILAPSSKINLVGIAEVLGRFGDIWGTYKTILSYVRSHPIEAAILVDLPDFNLRLARKLKALGIPVLYYISPQVWAWRKGRVNQIRKYVDKMLVLFEFEKCFYEAENVPVALVGHPFVDQIRPRSRDRAREIRVPSPRFALLPGSRKTEIDRHGPLLAKLYDRLRVKYPKAQFKLPLADTLSIESVQAFFGEKQVDITLESVQEVAAWADVAVVASGTAVLEVTLTETPLCLFYKTSRATGFIIKNIFGYRKWLGITNVLLGEEVVKEFVQERADVDLLLRECEHLLEDEAYREKQVRRLKSCRSALGGSHAVRRTADTIVSAIGHSPNLAVSSLAQVSKDI